MTYIKTVLAKDFAARHPPPRAAAANSLVVTLSRDFGAEGEAVALGLARALTLPVYDKEILDQMAARAKTDKFRFEAHDEQASPGFSAFLYSLMSGNPATLTDYRRHLCAAVLDLARQDCLIIGRGAHLILAGRPVFRVRVVGSQAVCAGRVACEFNLSLAEAERKVAAANQKRRQAVAALFQGSVERCSLEHADLFDLVVNTDHIPAAAAVDLILLALRASGRLREAALCKT